MAYKENKYRLNQENKEYMLITSTDGQSLKISCQDTKIPNAINYIKYYTLENIHSIDLLRPIPSLEETLIVLDKLISSEKIGVKPSNNQLKISIYLKRGGSIVFLLDPGTLNVAANQLQSNSRKYSEQQYNEQQYNEQQYNEQQYAQQQFNEQYPPEIFQQGAVQTKTIVHPIQFLKTTINNPIIKDPAYNQYPQTNYTNTNNNNNYNNANSLQPNYEQNYFDNSYGVQNTYENYEQNNINTYGQTETRTSKANYEQQQVNDSYGQRQQEQTQNNNNINYEHQPQQSYDVNNYNNYAYEQTGQQQSYDYNQYFQQQPQNVVDNTNNYQYQQQVTEKKYINKSVKPEIDYGHTGHVYETNQQYITEQKPSQSVPVNSNNNIPLNVAQQQLINQQQIIQQPQQQPSLLEQKLLKENENLKVDIQRYIAQNNQLKNQLQSFSVEREKFLSDKNTYATDNNEIITLRNENESLKAQLTEVPTLRRKVAEMEVLRGQLAELNSLRAKVSEMNVMKNQIVELEKLRNQVAENDILRQQISELGMLRAQAAESENLKKKVIELEDIKSQYEQEFLRMKSMIESQQQYDTNIEEENRELEYEQNVEQIAVKGDIIHNTAEIEMLTKKINKHNKKLTLNLLYKATIDSDKAVAFHEKCDSAESSLVLVETTKGKRFGGFTTCSWRGDCIDKKDEEAFVFSLDKMMTYDNIPGEDAVGCYPKFGPIFLGCQIRIYDNAFSKGGTTFEKGLNFNTEEDFELNGGERVFGVKEIEVYEVIPQ